MVCGFIAIKYENVYHVRLDDIADLVGHKKFSKDLILRTEMDVLSAIKFNI